MVKEKSEYVRYDISIDGKKTFVYASRNLDAKGVFEWMMEKPNDWIGKK